jgi:MerR family transcriptional regulator, copper efflux regulator
MQTRRVANESCECRPAMPVPPDPLTIGQVARRTGMRAKTIRYYEDIGLLPQPPRGANGYRRYSGADVHRIVLLQCIRSLGVPLSAARPFLMGAADARCAEVQEDLLRLVHQRLQALDREIAELHRLRSEVEGYQRALDASPSGATDQGFGVCMDMRCIALPSSEPSSEGAQGQTKDEGFHARVRDRDL